MDTAERWGLPPGFAPVRHSISDDVKDVVRGVLNAGEPVIISLTNEEGSVSVIATPQRLFTVRAGGVTSGVTGFNVREFPWEGITRLVMQHAAQNVKFVIHFKSSDGRTVEVGRRAAMGIAATENVMPFESGAGAQVFEAIHSIWTHKMQSG